MFLYTSNAERKAGYQATISGLCCGWEVYVIGIPQKPVEETTGVLAVSAACISLEGVDHQCLQRDFLRYEKPGKRLVKITRPEECRGEEKSHKCGRAGVEEKQKAPWVLLGRCHVLVGETGKAAAKPAQASQTIGQSRFVAGRGVSGSGAV
ncbi:hypothetical protein Bbelb_406070 [Branchiostoma belcheri]|nr:hypothetical protein Bbelb_406070 [Branchiostoma belcheri]